jgi:hypothetical protein
MNTPLRITAIVTLSILPAFARSHSAPHIYDVRSGRVTYSIKGSGQILGSQITTVGKERLIFDRHGAKTITETVEVKKQNILGQTKTDKTHTMTYLNGAIAYQVDFERKRIVRMPNPATSLGALMTEGISPAKQGRILLKQMGGKQIGEDTVLGFRCEVWKLMGTTQCLYRGIPLRIESNILGIKTTKIATEAAFDIALDPKAFTLPDFPITDQMGQTIPTDPAQREALDAREGKRLVNEQQHVVRNIRAALNAARAAGYDPATGARPTSEQKNAMADAMLPMMKQQFLQEVEPMRQMRACLRRADTREQAVACSRKHSRRFDPDAVPPRWDSATKRQTLEQMDRYLDRIVPCVKNAATMQQVQACMPRSR